MEDEYEWLNQLYIESGAPEATKEYSGYLIEMIRIAKTEQEKVTYKEELETILSNVQKLKDLAEDPLMW
jgi:hypothetical protein